MGFALVQLEWCDLLLRVYASLALNDLAEFGLALSQARIVKSRQHAVEARFLLEQVRAKELGKKEYTNAREGSKTSTRKRHRHYWHTQEGHEKHLNQAKFAAAESQDQSKEERSSTEFFSKDSDAEDGTDEWRAQEWPRLDGTSSSDEGHTEGWWTKGISQNDEINCRHVERVEWALFQ